MSFQKGTYLPQTYIIQEEMIATEHVSDMEQLGSFIYRLCSGKETYRLKRRSTRRRKSLAMFGVLTRFPPTSQLLSLLLQPCWLLCGERRGFPGGVGKQEIFGGVSHLVHLNPNLGCCCCRWVLAAVFLLSILVEMLR